MAGARPGGELEGRKVFAQKVGVQKVCMHRREGMEPRFFPCFVGFATLASRLL